MKNLIKHKKHLIFLEAHNPLCAIIINNTSYKSKKNKSKIKFDGIWSSSLSDSLSKGLPW